MIAFLSCLTLVWLAVVVVAFLVLLVKVANRGSPELEMIAGQRFATRANVSEPDTTGRPVLAGSLPARAAFSADSNAGRPRATPPTANQIRAYWWCSPPRIARQRMRPAVSTARDIGASLLPCRSSRV